MSEKQIKSKQRVAEHGEVFTADREVEAMLDLVDDETRNITSTFLEPACGEGAFLIKILERKMEAVAKKYGKKASDYEANAFIALTTLYGIDIMADNAEKCRERLFAYWDKEYTKHCKGTTRQDVRDAAKYVLQKNILVGNALTLKMVDDNQKDTNKPIIFAEWGQVPGGKIKRKDYRLDVILKASENEAKAKAKHPVTYSLFDSDDSSNNSYNLYEIDPVTHDVIPKPLKEYPLVDYWEVQKQ